MIIVSIHISIYDERSGINKGRIVNDASAGIGYMNYQIVGLQYIS